MSGHDRDDTDSLDALVEVYRGRLDRPGADIGRACPLYWTQYGRALSRVRGRRDDAVRALRRAELISPHQVQPDPLTRDIIGELLARTHRDSPLGRELRKMAARAGLPR